MAKGKYARKRFWKKARETSVSDCELSKRTANILMAAGINTKADIILADENKLRKISGIGEKSMAEINSIKKQRKAD